jgi:hypothetical protein
MNISVNAHKTLNTNINRIGNWINQKSISTKDLTYNIHRFIQFHLRKTQSK